jgi:hypothetical protein
MDKGAVLDGSEHSALFNGDGRGARCVCWTLNRLFELQNEEHLKTSTCHSTVPISVIPVAVDKA